MTHYCLGFVYRDNYVFLIRKNLDCKLEFMRGKLNGIGGHIEKDESPMRAMDREFREETKLDLQIKWQEKGMILGNGYDVTIFRGEISTNNFYRISFPINSDEGEIDRYCMDSELSEVVDNIPILLPLINTHNGYKYILNYRGHRDEGLGHYSEPSLPVIECIKE